MMVFSECWYVFPRSTAGRRHCSYFFLLPAHMPAARRASRDSSVRRQHGGHACGVAKQFALFVRLTPSRNIDPEGRAWSALSEPWAEWTGTASYSSRLYPWPRRSFWWERSSLLADMCLANLSYPLHRPAAIVGYRLENVHFKVTTWSSMREIKLLVMTEPVQSTFTCKVSKH